MTKILIKKLSDKVLIPKYETPGSSGMDIAALIDEDITIKPGHTVIIPTGFALAVPEKYEIQIRPRSGLAAKNSVTVINTPGTIDSDYRGEIKVILINLGKKEFIVKDGMRIAQMILCPAMQGELVEVSELSSTTRGAGGFGSTGVN